ncbi:hypothetical protein [Huintestinicola sp.]|uniref:hypothetical protein n=1 Tax=Huintestinicola sp. TaxID=2981661 RepID=UPI003D7D62D3
MGNTVFENVRFEKIAGFVESDIHILKSMKDNLLVPTCRFTKFNKDVPIKQGKIFSLHADRLIQKSDEVKIEEIEIQTISFCTADFVGLEVVFSEDFCNLTESSKYSDNSRNGYITDYIMLNNLGDENRSYTNILYSLHSVYENPMYKVLDNYYSLGIAAYFNDKNQSYLGEQLSVSAIVNKIKYPNSISDVSISTGCGGTCSTINQYNSCCSDTNNYCISGTVMKDPLHP